MVKKTNEYYLSITNFTSGKTQHLDFTNKTKLLESISKAISKGFEVKAGKIVK